VVTTVLCFGTFDPLHEGHRHFLRQAGALGDQLLVVVTSDASVLAEKGRAPYQPEDERLAAVQEEAMVSSARLGSTGNDRYELLSVLDFDVVALGYDQRPADAVVRAELARRGKARVRVVRLTPFEPARFKSSLLRRP